MKKHMLTLVATDGNFSLDKTIGSSIIGKMKGRVADLNKKPEMKEAYKAYIKLVVEALIKHNSSLLTLNGYDGKPNFYICMASPTKWNDRNKAEYLHFFNDAIAELGLTLEWIINESDAAFFSHRDVVEHNELTLVIGYGSSTLDYTVMYQGKKVSEDKWSNDQLGAGENESTIMKTGSWSRTVMDAISDILDRNIFLFNKTDWTKERTSNERNFIARELVDEVLKHTSWLNNVTYGEDNSFLTHMSKSIKNKQRNLLQSSSTNASYSTRHSLNKHIATTKD